MLPRRGLYIYHWQHDIDANTIKYNVIFFEYIYINEAQRRGRFNELLELLLHRQLDL